MRAGHHCARRSAAARMAKDARYHGPVSKRPPNPNPRGVEHEATLAAPGGLSVPLPPGKLAPDFLARLIESSLPAEVVLGPRIGEDACAIEIEAGTLVAATDPITLTGAGVGAHAVAVNANDVAVTGARPRWFLACVLLPEGSTRHDAEALFAEMRRALDEVGATLVGGHTEVTGAVRQPLVVGQMLGIAAERTVPTGGLRPGHAVLQIGPRTGGGRGGARRRPAAEMPRRGSRAGARGGSIRPRHAGDLGGRARSRRRPGRRVRAP